MSTRHSPLRHPRLDLYRLLLFGLSLAYCVLFTRLAFDQHLGMRTHKADLGQIDQAVWNSSRGRFVEMTDNGFVATRLTDHVEPILALISPLFWLWDDVRALLLFQVVMVAMGAWPLYELALRRLDQLLTPAEQTQIWCVEPLRQWTRPLALLLALAYLLTPQLQSAVLTEFHAVPLAVPLLLWSFWAIETHRWQQFVIAALLVACVKEETALLAAGLGVWAWWVGGGAWRVARGEDSLPPAPRPLPLAPAFLALAVISISLVWFYIATFVIVPAHAQQVYKGAESIYFQRFGALGNSPLGIFKSFFTQPRVVWQIATEPARVDYLRGLLAPFGFLTLLAPELILLALPVLLANLLSAYPAQYYGEFHYSAPLVPYFAVSAAYGLGRLWRWFGRRVNQTSSSFQHLPAASIGVMALIAFWRNSRNTLRPLLATVLGLWLLGWAGVSYLQAGRGPFAVRYDPTPVTAHDRLLAHFVAELPADAAVTATAAVHPHVSHRRFVYQFPIGLDPPGQANWALLDVTTNTDMAPGDVKARVEQMLAADWGVVDAADGFLLLRKGATMKTIPAAFYDFARAPQTVEKLAGVADLALHTVTVADWPRWRQTKVQIEWQVGDHFNPATLTPHVELVAPDGAELYSFAQVAPPAWLWYPPERWQPGEIVRMTTPWLYLPKVWGVRTERTANQLPVTTFLRHPESGTTLGDLFWRTAQGQIVRFSPQSAAVQQRQTLEKLVDAHGLFQVGQAKLALHALLPQTTWSGAPLLLQLNWSALKDWPADLSVFVHLRRGDQTIAQVDGPPRFFYLDPAAPDGLPGGVLAEWRQLTLPSDLKMGETLTLVLGLYHPQNGQRAAVLDDPGRVVANELVIGQLHVMSPPIPDQACALIPQTCAAQPLR
ncbi:MAG: DUF2079 domain-containing protein [Caldilineaceae bacterium]